MPTVEKVIRHEREIGYTLVGVPNIGDGGATYSVEFDVYEHYGVATDGPPTYRDESFEQSPTTRPVDTIEEATACLSGRVKWDGCSDWDFSALGHFCSKEQAVALGRLMAALYDMAAAMMPETCDWLE